MSFGIKVLIVPQMPYCVARGGMEVQQLETIKALRVLGVEVEPLDLWKTELDATVAHVFGSEISQSPIVDALHVAGIPLVTSAMFMPTHGNLQYHLMRMMGGMIPQNPVLRRRSLLQKSNAVIALTQSEKQTLVRYLDLDPATIHVIPNGVAPQFFESTPELFQTHTGLMDVVLCVASIERRKNQLNVIAALSDVDRDVVFIGDPIQRASGAEVDYVQAFMSAVKAHPRMHWLSAVPHNHPLLASAYAAAHVHVLVSHQEAQGMVTLEAAAAGANIVVSDLPSQREQYGDTVEYAQTTSTTAIQAAVLRALAKPRGSSPLKSDVLMSWNDVVSQLLDVYRRVLPR